MLYEASLLGRLWFIPNAGSWITTRDRTNYAIPDGVMIEGFAEGGPASFYALGDWQLQMDRALRAGGACGSFRWAAGWSFLPTADLC